MAFETDLQKTQFYDKYSRWNPTAGRRETWEETVARVMGFFADQLAKRGLSHRFTAVEWDRLAEAMLNLEVLPSMRVVQMAGPALERCNVGAYNCAYLPLQDWQCFGELLYILMQGTGCGFSVENHYVEMFPVIAPQNGELHRVWNIEDTTEGWCNALVAGLKSWATGYDVVFDYSQIRPYGTPLKTKGGTASGPQPLKDLLDFARKMILKHQGRKLSSLNLHDLATFCGSIVQVGGVRRAAEISLSDLNDDKMRHAKNGQFWQHTPERAMANNTAVYEQKPTMKEFVAEWDQLVASGTGERGIFNRQIVVPYRRQAINEGTKWGLNPCGEIVLRPFEFCNLSIVVARPEDQLGDLDRKVKLATQFGLIQSLLTDFTYLRPEWQRNCEQERLLGVDITGQMDNKWLNNVGTRDSVYGRLSDVAYNTARQWASTLGVSLPAAITCVKPSGNSSQLLGVSSGIHPRYSPYYIRRLRIGADSPVAKLLIASGVPHYPEIGQRPDNPAIWVFEFPVESPQGAVCRQDCTAIEQLEQWLSCKRNYTEHNPSCTIYVKEDEWWPVGEWVWDNWQDIGGLSFLPYDGGQYQLAPYSECTKEEYEKALLIWPVIDWTKLSYYEHSDTTTVAGEFACVSGLCEL